MTSLAITMKGFGFMERWYHAEHIPTHIVRLYQLLLKLIWMKGIMVVSYAQRLSYDSKVVNQALSKEYVEIVERPSGLPSARALGEDISMKPSLEKGFPVSEGGPYIRIDNICCY